MFRFIVIFAVIAASAGVAFARQDPPAAPAAQAPTVQAPAAQQPVAQAPAAQAPSIGVCPTTTKPPAVGSGTVICQTELRFHPVNESIVEAQTYLYYIQTPLSRPSDGTWVPFNEQTEQSLLDDFKRLWATSFLDNLWIETVDA